MQIKEISRVSQNPFFDDGKSNNGGGCSQPLVEFEFNGIEGSIDDTSCGDFGARYSVSYDGKYFLYDNVSEHFTEESSFSKQNADDVRFVEAFNSKYSFFDNFRISFLEEIEEGEKCNWC